MTSLAETYIRGLRQLVDSGEIVEGVTDPRSVGSRFGVNPRPYKEIRGFTFSLDSTSPVFVEPLVKQFYPRYAAAFVLWTFSGGKDVQSISRFNPLGKVFSDNGKYYEASFGDRIFGGHTLLNVINLLNADRSSRRAMIPIFNDRDLATLPKDTPCIGSLQPFIRENRLELILHMRSQSAFSIFPYDLFLILSVGEFLSSLFEIEFARIHYMCNSFHYYLEEEDVVKKFVKNPKFEVHEFGKMEGSQIANLREIKNRWYNGSNDIILPEFWNNLFDLIKD